MAWKPALTSVLLNGKSPERMKSFLRAELPPFRVPTDPVAWGAEARRLRRRALKEVYLKGFPRAIVQSRPKVVWGDVLRICPQYRIRKLRYECYPGYWIPALLYEPARLRGRAPVVLNPNGHHSGGKAATYKQIRCANLARRGVLALSIEFIGMSELRADCISYQYENFHNGLAMLNLTGMAGVGLVYLALKKGLDVLLAHPHADPSRVGVTGVSGGGLQSVLIAAMDERVNLCVPVAGHTSMAARIARPDDIGDMEQAPVDLTTVLDYQQMTAMLAPRPTLLILNEKDTWVPTACARPVIYDAVKPTFHAFGADARFQFYSNVDPGTHNYEADNRARFYRFLMEQWGIPGPARDIHRDGEVLPEPRLNVGLPMAQETIQTLAVRRARRLARRRRTPRTASERQELRRRLREIIRLPSFDSQSRSRPAAFSVRGGVLRIGPWAVPVSASRQSGAVGTEVIVADGGRANAPLWRLGQQPAARHRFFADILGAGENACEWTFEMLLEATGHRLLGHQTAQVLAIAQTAAAATGVKRVRLVSFGRATGVAALLAAGLEPALFESLTSFGHLTSLSHLLETCERYETLPGLFCFGLLEVADTPELTALLENVPYHQPARAVAALAPLKRSPDR